MLSCVCLLCIELLQWVVHLKNMNSNELKLAVTKVVTCHLFIGLSLLSQHLLLDFIDVLACILSVSLQTCLLDDLVFIG